MRIDNTIAKQSVISNVTFNTTLNLSLSVSQFINLFHLLSTRLLTFLSFILIHFV